MALDEMSKAAENYIVAIRNAVGDIDPGGPTYLPVCVLTDTWKSERGGAACTMYAIACFRARHPEHPGTLSIEYVGEFPPLIDPALSVLVVVGDAAE